MSTLSSCGREMRVILGIFLPIWHHHISVQHEIPENCREMCVCVCGLTFCEREKEMLYLTTHSTHFIYGYIASDIWLRTVLIVKKETHCRHIGYSYRLIARVILYAPSHRQDNTYHGLLHQSWSTGWNEK